MIKETLLADDLEFTGERFVPGMALGQIEVEHLQRYYAALPLAKGKVVLDAASGAGYGSAVLATEAAEVIGIDISAEAVAHANKLYGKAKNLSFKEASIAELPFPDSRFDVIVSFETIEHVNEDLQNSFLKEIKRCLKPDGLLIMSSPDKRTYTDLTGIVNEFHVKEFYFDEYLAFLGKEFTNIDCYVQGEHNVHGEFITKYNVQNEDKLRTINNLCFDEDKNLYILTVCSNRPIDKNTEVLSSVYHYAAVPVGFLGGKGEYAAENMVRPVEFLQGKELSATFSFKEHKPEGKFRFDPLEGFSCRVDIVEIETDAKAWSLSALNAYRNENNSFAFLTLDPNLEISGDFSQATYITIKYKLVFLSSAELANGYGDIITRLNSEITQKNNELWDLENKKNNELWDLKNKLNWELEHVTGERNQLNQELSQLVEATNNDHNTFGYKVLAKLRKIFPTL